MDTILATSSSAKLTEWSQCALAFSPKLAKSPVTFAQRATQPSLSQGWPLTNNNQRAWPR